MTKPFGEFITEQPKHQNKRPEAHASGREEGENDKEEPHQNKA